MRKRKCNRLLNRAAQGVIFAIIWILLIHSTGLPENTKMKPRKANILSVLKRRISITADGDFGEIKKTETPCS